MNRPISGTFSCLFLVTFLRFIVCFCFHPSSFDFYIVLYSARAATITCLVTLSHQNYFSLNEQSTSRGILIFTTNRLVHSHFVFTYLRTQISTNFHSIPLLYFSRLWAVVYLSWRFWENFKTNPAETMGTHSDCNEKFRLLQLLVRVTKEGM